ncbi:MAG: hypothetical protein EGQ20_15265 [Bacteroides oleiciplenus]|nr:hypothetical protein [Bacteroides oleiciplenus]
MKSFIGIIFCSILLFCSSCTDENETDNGRRTDHYNSIPLTIRVITTDFENLPSSGQPSTRTFVKDEHLKTEFTEGDKIGIFAVKNGIIVDNVNNTPLIYNASNGSWNPVENGNVLYWYDGASYIAYYPYRKDIEIDASKSTSEIITSLVGNEILKPLKDQSTREKHIASDLMIATGTPTTNTPSVLNLLFQHQFTLLVLQPQAYVGCFAPKNAGFVYHQESRILGTDSASTEVALNNITPYLIDSMKYCAIVPSQEFTKISGNYTTTNGRNGEETKINYSGSTTTFASGKCYTLKVVSPVPGKGSTVRGLYPGDFVFQNNEKNRIEIHPGNGLLEKNGKIYDYGNAIGMVITCDPKKMTDEECKKNGWTHAYVMGLDNLGSGYWGPEDLMESGIPTMTELKQIRDNMNGYSETEWILKNYETSLTSYPAFNLIKKQRNKEATSIGSSRSPCFLPSIGQWFDMLTNICGWSVSNTSGLNDTSNGNGSKTLGNLTKQLAKVDNKLPNFNSNYRLGFSCSSQHNKDKCWMLLWHINDPTPEFQNWDRICLQGYTKLAEWNVRPFFAF